MPRLKSFKPSSIIYFMNDKADSVFLLKNGKVNLAYSDIQSGEEINDTINNGEFFGVKSGLIGHPREETAVVLTNSTIIEFSSTEFESLITKNTSIIIKMLRSFSNQLRRVGKQVQSFVTTQITADPAADFFQIGDYYYKNKKYTQSITVFKRFINYYPANKLTQLAKKRLNDVEQALNSYGEGGGPTPMLEDNRYSMQDSIAGDILPNPDEVAVDKEEEKIFYQSMAQAGKMKYAEAINGFNQLLNSKNKSFMTAAQHEIGKCFYQSKQYDQCITHYYSFIEKNQNFPLVGEVLYYIGMSYKNKNILDKAREFFKRVLALKTIDDNLKRKVQNEIKEL